MFVHWAIGRVKQNVVVERDGSGNINVSNVDGDFVVERDGSSYPLSRCGVAWNERFTFYDQVHTTGMDIKQAIDARAVCTLGKDMTLRESNGPRTRAPCPRPSRNPSLNPSLKAPTS